VQLRHRTSSPAFTLLLVSLVSLMAFFVLRPLLAPEGYYHSRPRGTTNDYWWLIVIAFIPYGLAIRSYVRGKTPSIRKLLVWAIVLFVGFIPAPAQQSQDVYQYLVYGRLAIQGANPYVSTPVTQDDWTDHALWRDTRSAYGPIWTLTSAGVVRGSRGNLTAAFLLMKMVAAALAIAGTILLALSVRSQDSFASDSGLAVLVFAFNPLVIVSVGLGAHADVAVAAGFAAAYLFFKKDRRIGVTLALTLTALIKAYAGIALLLWLVHLVARRGLGRGSVHAGIAFAITAGAFAPYWKGLRTFDGLSQVSRLASASLTGGLMRLLSGRWDSSAGLTTVGSVLRILVVAILIVAFFQIGRSARDNPWHAIASMLAVYVIVSPWYLSWHVLGLLALAAVLPAWRGTQPVLLFTATSLVVLPGALQTVARYGPPLALARRGQRKRA